MSERRVPPATTALQKPEEKELQALAMLTERVLGKSIKEVAEQFRVSPATVHDRLALARESGVLPQAKLMLLERLLPRALTVYIAAMDQQPVSEESVKAARDVLFGLGVLEKQTKVVQKGPSEDDTLASYRVEREKRKAIDAEFTVVVEEGEKE